VLDSCFVVIVHDRGEAVQPRKVRLGVTASRKVGGAVVRNRLKRRVREWFRAERSWMRPGIDLLVIARHPAVSKTARELDSALGTLARGAGAAS